MKTNSKNSPNPAAKDPAAKDPVDAPERHARDTDPMPDTVPLMEAHPDTVKLTHQTWQPPPSSMDTVKLTPQPPSSDDAETDIQEARTEQTDIAPASSPIVGTGHAEVAGEIGSIGKLPTRAELPARIVSAPPSTLGSPIKLPGMPAPATASQQTDTPSSVPRPSPPPSNPRMDRDGRGVRVDNKNGTPAIATERRPPSQDPQMRPPSQDPQMRPTAGPLPPQRHVDPTMVLRIHKGPGTQTSRAIAITAIAASLIGLAVGYILWGLPNSDTSAESSSTQNQQPAVSIPLCQVAITSEPDKAKVRANGKVFGHTPLDIELPCDTTSLTLSKRGFVRQSMPLTLSASSPQTTHGILERKQFKIHIKSSPKGAMVLHGDQELGKTPLKVTLPGYIETTIVLRRKGYLDRKATLVPKKSTSVNYRLKRDRSKR